MNKNYGYTLKMVKKKHYPQRSRYARLLCDVSATLEQIDTLPEALKAGIEIVATRYDWQVGHIFWVEDGSGMKLISSPIWYLSNPQKFTSFQDETMKLEFSIG